MRLTVLLTAVLLSITALFLIRYPETTSGQINRPDWTPCGCFCGFEPPYPPVPPVAYVIFNGEPCTGILAADACDRDLSTLPAEQLTSVCGKVRARKGFKSFKQTCPVFAKYCPDEPPKLPTGKGCHNSATPWFGAGDSPSCTDVQAPVITARGDAVNVSICGFSVFTGKNPRAGDAASLIGYLTAMKAHVQSQTGSKICCDDFRRATRSGSICDPRTDIDCDLKPNDSDVTGTNVKYPDINLFTQGKNASIDPFPSGLDPDDPNFLPNATARDSKGVGDCPCQWELVKGTLTCSPDGVKKHVYTATWQCPSNGKEVLTTQEADASQPCNKARRTGGTADLFDLLLALPKPFEEFVSRQVSPTGCP